MEGERGRMGMEQTNISIIAAVQFQQSLEKESKSCDTDPVIHGVALRHENQPTGGLWRNVLTAVETGQCGYLWL